MDVDSKSPRFFRFCAGPSHRRRNLSCPQVFAVYSGLDPRMTAALELAGSGRVKFPVVISLQAGCGVGICGLPAFSL